MDTLLARKQILSDAILSVMPGKVAVVIDDPEQFVGKTSSFSSPILRRANPTSVR